jgi:alpha-mannosidase
MFKAGHRIGLSVLISRSAGVTFSLLSVSHSRVRVLALKIPLPAGRFNRVYVLAASADGDQQATFRVGEKAVDATIQDWGGFIGQWDDRIWEGKEMTGLKPGFIKRAKVAWFASHRHTADGANEPYAYSYLFAYPLDVPAGATTLTLPDNRKIRILAISVAEEGATVKPVQPLYDTLER